MTVIKTSYIKIQLTNFLRLCYFYAHSLLRLHLSKMKINEVLVLDCMVFKGLGTGIKIRGKGLVCISIDGRIIKYPAEPLWIDVKESVPVIYAYGWFRRQELPLPITVNELSVLLPHVQSISGKVKLATTQLLKFKPNNLIGNSNKELRESKIFNLPSLGPELNIKTVNLPDPLYYETD